MAHAEWHAGVLFSSPQCKGVVTALPKGLQARTNQDGNATIEWKYFDYFYFTDEEYKLALNAAVPRSWFFLIDCEDLEGRAQWRQLLVKQGVSQRT